MCLKIRPHNQYTDHPLGIGFVGLRQNSCMWAYRRIYWRLWKTTLPNCRQRDQCSHMERHFTRIARLHNQTTSARTTSIQVWKSRTQHRCMHTCSRARRSLSNQITDSIHIRLQLSTACVACVCVCRLPADRMYGWVVNPIHLRDIHTWYMPHESPAGEMRLYSIGKQHVIVVENNSHHVYPTPKK